VNKVLLSKDVRFIICKLNKLIRQARPLDLTYIKKLGHQFEKSFRSSI
jgi:hypothetical protein